MTNGEVCHFQTNNVSIIKQYTSSLSDREKSKIGLDVLKWSLLIVKWNEVSYSPIAPLHQVRITLACELLLYAGRVEDLRETYILLSIRSIKHIN